MQTWPSLNLSSNSRRDHHNVDHVSPYWTGKSVMYNYCYCTEIEHAFNQPHISNSESDRRSYGRLKKKTNNINLKATLSYNSVSGPIILDYSSPSRMAALPFSAPKVVRCPFLQLGDFGASSLMNYQPSPWETSAPARIYFSTRLQQKGRWKFEIFLITKCRRREDNW